MFKKKPIVAAIQMNNVPSVLNACGSCGRVFVGIQKKEYCPQCEKSIVNQCYTPPPIFDDKLQYEIKMARDWAGTKVVRGRFPLLFGDAA